MAIRGTGSSWYTILGNTPVPLEGETVLTFEVVDLLETIEFGFAVADV